MTTCKKCGAEVSVWKRTLLSGMCKKCSNEMSQHRKGEQALREAEKLAGAARAEAERERNRRKPIDELNKRLADQKIDHLIFVGLNGYAIALHRETGHIVWSNNAMKSGYVSLLVDGDRLIASTNGYMYCLDPLTGNTLWHNPLEGYGTAPTSITSVRGISTSSTMLQQIATIVEQQRIQGLTIASSHFRNNDSSNGEFTSTTG